MLKTKIKANAITNLTDARYFAAWGVEWMGFQLDPYKEQFLTSREAKSVMEWIEGPVFVGEVGMLDPEIIHQMAMDLKLNTFQVDMFYPREKLRELEDFVLIREIVVERDTSPQVIQSHVNEFRDEEIIFFLNFEKNGINWREIQSGKAISFERLKSWCSDLPIILGLDFQPFELEEILNSLTLYGLGISGGEEEKVGYKSFDELDDLFNELNE